jgi:hypothetical protein
MPLLTRWYIKSALAYLVAALLLGFVLALPLSANLPDFIRTMTPGLLPPLPGGLGDADDFRRDLLDVSHHHPGQAARQRAAGLGQLRLFERGPAAARGG